MVDIYFLTFTDCINSLFRKTLPLFLCYFVLCIAFHSYIGIPMLETKKICFIKLKLYRYTLCACIHKS